MKKQNKMTNTLFFKRVILTDHILLCTSFYNILNHQYVLIYR